MYLRRSERLIACWLCWPSESVVFFFGDIESFFRGLSLTSKEIFEGELRVFLGLSLSPTTEETFPSKAKLRVLGRLGLSWALIGRPVALIGDFGGLPAGLLGLSGRHELEGSFFVGVNLLDVRRGLSLRHEVPDLLDGVTDPGEEAILPPSGEHSIGAECKPAGEVCSKKAPDNGRTRELFIVSGRPEPLELIGAEAISILPEIERLGGLERFRLSPFENLTYTLQTSAWSWKLRGF